MVHTWPDRIPVYHTFHERNIPLLIDHLGYIKKNNLMITVDDGDLSFYSILFPLICQYEVPTVLFVITSLIGTRQPFWWDEVHYYLGPDAGAKQVRRLKNIPNHERLLFLAELRARKDKAPMQYQQLTVAQLKEMEAAGITLANHSHTHPMFDQCTDDEIRNELQASRQFFTAHGLSGYSTFAYPNGSFSERTEQILAASGIESAFLFNHKLNRSPVNAMRISRLSVDDYTPMWKFKLILSGWHSYLAPIRRRIHSLTS